MKILVVTKDMYVGGVQKACVNFVNFLAKKGKDVDLIIFNKNGPLAKDIDEKVNQIKIGDSMKPFSISQADAKNYGFKFFFKRTLNACWCKLMGNEKPLKRALKKQEELDQYYDVAISFQPSFGKKSLTVGCAEFVLQKVKAKTKLIFMHGDYEKAGLNEPYANEIFGQFDKILCVSKSCADAMKNANETLQGKVGYIYNICDAEDIKSKSNEPTTKVWENGFELVTVARLGEEKGHVRLLKQLKKLHDEGLDFVYTIVGDGKERQNIENFIYKNEMASYVKLLGNKTNPYPYMKNANLFVLPSHHESYGLVLVESMIVGVPVMSTATCAAEEVVGDWGFVCENSEEGIYSKLKSLLQNPNEIELKKQKLINYDYQISEIEAQLDKLLNGFNIDK